MNNTFSLEQKSRTGNLDANLIIRQRKLDLMARFTEMKSINPKMKQMEVAKELGYSSSTFQRYRNDIKMQSPYKSSNPKITPKTSNDLKGPQMTSKNSNENDKLISEKVKPKNNLIEGDPIDVNPSNGRDLIEQFFSDSING